MEKFTTVEFILGGGLLYLMIDKLLIPLYKKKVDTDKENISKVINYVNILWDAHNEKKDDSVKLKSLQENFTTHEKKFEIFAATQANMNTLFSSYFEDLKRLIEHKENGNKMITNSIFTVLERIENKLEE